MSFKQKIGSFPLTKSPASVYFVNCCILGGHGDLVWEPEQHGRQPALAGRGVAVSGGGAGNHGPPLQPHPLPTLTLRPRQTLLRGGKPLNINVIKNYCTYFVEPESKNKMTNLQNVLSLRMPQNFLKNPGIVNNSRKSLSKYLKRILKFMYSTGTWDSG